MRNRNHFKPGFHVVLFHAALVLLLLLCQASAAFGARGVDHAAHRVNHAGRHAGRRGAHRKTGHRARHKPGAVVHRGNSRSVVGATAVLLGDTAVEWQYDSLVAGQAEAFRLRVGSSGLASTVHIYISAGNAAGVLIVGLYSSAAGHPGSLLSTGSVPASSPGTWTAASIAPVELLQGRSYWLAILGEGGRLRYRDRANGPCPSETSAQHNLSALPASWRTGATYSDCPVSAYVTAAALVSPMEPALPGESLAPPVVAAVPPPTSAPPTEPPPYPPAAPENTALPSIEGVAKEGQKLTASHGKWTEEPTSYAYRWQDCDATGESCAKISGATGSTYNLVGSDVGHTVRVVVTATNAGGASEASSEATGVVEASSPPPPPPPPKNTVPPSIDGGVPPEEGHTLSASTGTWTGSPNAYEYQWQDCDAAGASCAEVAGATSETYKLRGSDVGHTMRVVVTASNAGGSGEASSEATDEVVARQATGPQIYVAQAGAGDQSGESCADAHSLDWLNTGGNWGAGAGKVAPGTTVDLCGTLTEPIETRGEGSSGKPITIYFTVGAKIAMGGEGCPGSGCIHVPGGSEYITIDGGEGGRVENTDTGSGKQTPATTTGIQANGCKHCAIENLTIADLYVPKKGTDYGDTENRGISIQEETPEYVTIDHDTFTNLGWAVNVEMGQASSHIAVEYDTFDVVTHGFTPSAGFSGGEIGPVVFAHNYFYGNLEWEDGSTDTNHVDGLHCYSADGRGYTPHYTGLYIYDNYIEVEGNNVTAPIFLEGGSGEGRTPCADKTSNIWIFNNVLWNASQTVEGGNGLLGAFSGEPRIYDNTLIGEAAATGVCEEYNSVAEKIHYKNNLTTSCKTLINAEPARFDTSEMAHNLWANGGDTDEALICENPERHAYGLDDFSDWKACMGGSGVEEGSKAAASAKVKLTGDKGTEGKPEAGSPAIEAGANLTSLCGQTPEEALCNNINGAPRPSAGAWGIGAY
jgi:hypothetical protein